MYWNNHLWWFKYYFQWKWAKKVLFKQRYLIQSQNSGFNSIFQMGQTSAVRMFSPFQDTEAVFYCANGLRDRIGKEPHSVGKFYAGHYSWYTSVRRLWSFSQNLASCSRSEFLFSVVHNSLAFLYHQRTSHRRT